MPEQFQQCFPTAILFAFMFFFLSDSALAQEKKSVPISFTQYMDSSNSTSTWFHCATFIVGSHDDPVGNGSDSDYFYPFERPGFFGYADPTPPAWTGVAEDIPGERITFTNSWSIVDGPLTAEAKCNDIAPWPVDDPNAYYELQKPTASFTWVADEAALLKVNFDASDSDDPDGDIVSYEWDFDGDNVPDGGGEKPSFTYEERGTYNVNLTVTDNDGLTDETRRAVNVVGPDFSYQVSWEKLGGGPGKTTGQNTDDEPRVGDSLRVIIDIKNTGDVALDNLFIPGGEAGIQITSDPENALVFERIETVVIPRLNLGESGSLAFIYTAQRTTKDALIHVLGVEGFGIHPVSGGSTAYSETEDSCPVPGKNGSITADGDNLACLVISINPAPRIVNSVTDDPLDPALDPTKDGCSTGGTIDRDGTSEPECTLRAAMQIAAASTSGNEKIEFDIPDGESTHRIMLIGDALPPVPLAIAMAGPSEEGAPIEIDGEGLSSGATIGFDLGGGDEAATVENLAFFGFPETVLALRGNGSRLAGTYIGSDWAKSYTSTDPLVTDPLRNGGDAVLVTGDNTVIGGSAEQANLIIGSKIGVTVNGASGVEIMGNDIGVVESPHAEHGIKLFATSSIRIGSPDQPNRISFNLEHGILIDDASVRVKVQGNEIIRNRNDGINISQQSNSDEAIQIGGDGPDEGNIIERSIGAGIRVSGPSDATPDAAPFLFIQGNKMGKNEAQGIVLEGGSRVLIGGETSEPGTSFGNEIKDGIHLSSGYATRIQGNLIARLDAETGYSAPGPVLMVEGINNIIGGDSPAAGNIIYGVLAPGVDRNDPETYGDARGLGILESGTRTLIQNNLVGNDGSEALPLHVGIQLAGTDAELIDNTISGNIQHGLVVMARATIEGNRIGTTTGGGRELGNGIGVFVRETAIIGGFKDGPGCDRPCNVISGNIQQGIMILPSASGSEIQGNMIGVDVDGVIDIGNGEEGILVLADNVIIGGDNDIELGDCLGPCNIIAGNDSDGVRNFSAFEIDATQLISRDEFNSNRADGAGTDGASGLAIEGNFIGTGIPLQFSNQPSGASGNGGSGIALGAMGNDNNVGNTVLGGNLIVGNAHAGVTVLGSSNQIGGESYAKFGGERNQIRGNRIYKNGRIPIDLYGDNLVGSTDGWDAADANDNDIGPNTLLNWPYLIESGPGTGDAKTLLVYFNGDHDATPSPYKLDVYTATSCRGGTADAENFLISREIMFPTGSVELDAEVIEIPFLATMPYYVATLTDSQGNTSEFGNCRKADNTPIRALENVTEFSQKLINRLLLTLLDPLAPGKTHSGPESIMVLRTDAAPDVNLFENSVGMTPSGQSLIPKSTVGPFWEVIALDASSPIRFDVCLDVTDAGVSDDLVVMGRGIASNGLWRPFVTRLETIDTIIYACADDVSMMQLSLGAGDQAELAPPLLVLPVNNAQNLDLSTISMQWETVVNAVSYDMQISLTPGFSFPLSSVSGVLGTSIAAPVVARDLLHYWRVRGITGEGNAGPWSTAFEFSTGVTGVDTEIDGELPDAFVLESNYPNPFNPSTTIPFSVPKQGNVRLSVYNLLGQEVAVLVDGVQTAGRYTAHFEAGAMPTGVYLVRLVADGFTKTRKILLIK